MCSFTERKESWKEKKNILFESKFFQKVAIKLQNVFKSSRSGLSLKSPGNEVVWDIARSGT